MAVLMGPLTARDTVFDDPTTRLASIYDVHVVAVGGRSFAYGTGFNDDGVSGFEIGADGSLTSAVNLADGGALELDGSNGLASATVGGNTYLYVAGYTDDGISAFRVNGDGTLTGVQDIPDAGALELDGVQYMTTATVGGDRFLIAAGVVDDGLSVFQVAVNGTLTNTDNVNTSSLADLDGAWDVETAAVGGRTFVLAASYDGDALNAFELRADGTLALRDSVSDAGALNLDGASGLTAVRVGTATYVVASGEDDNGLSVFRLGDTGLLTPVFNLDDTAALGLDDAAGVDGFTLGGEAFVAVSSGTDDALGVFHVGAGGVLTEVTSVLDSAALALDGSYHADFAVVGGRPMLVNGSLGDNGLSVFEFGAGDDVLTGTTGADVLLGLAGADRLVGLAGADRLLGGNGADRLVGGLGRDQLGGGAGADLFVFTATAQSVAGAGRDRILDFQGGVDDIALGQIDANETLAGNQGFRLDAGGAFLAGEIRQSALGGDLLIRLNTDGDAAAEMSILVEGRTVPLGAGSFLF